MAPASLAEFFSPRASGASDNVQAVAAGNVNFLPYFTVGALSVLAWDILSELRRDLYLLGLVRPRSFQKIPYLLARLSVLAYLLADAVFQIIPLHDCTQIRTAQVSLFVITIATTYLLILLRIRVAFQNDWYISGLFGGLWMVVVAGASTIVDGTSLEAVTPSTGSLCAVSQNIKPYAAGSLLGPLLYTCLAYMFISGRLVVGVRMDLTMEHGVREFVLGEFVPIFTKGLLLEGQAFYLIAVVVQLISFILFLSGTTSSTRFILVDSSLAITNMMACKVYRGTLYQEIDEELNKINVPLLISQSVSSCNVAGIRVTKTVEQF